MTRRAQRWELLPTLALGGIVGWLTYSRLTLWHSARTGVSGVLSVPPGWFWLLVGIVGVPLFLLALAGALRCLVAWTVRLFYVFAALVLSIQVFVLPPVYLPPPVTADLTAAAALETVATRVHARADAEGLPVDEKALRGLLDGLPPPPYRHRSAQVSRWRLVVRRGCTGPVLDPEGAPPGTLFYCVAGDRQRAWISFVGTGGRAAGEADIGRDLAGEPLVLRVEAPGASAHRSGAKASSGERTPRGVPAAEPTGAPPSPRRTGASGD